MRFNYVAYTRDLAIAKGHVDARNEEEARSALVQDGYKLLAVRPAWRMPGLEDILPSLFKVDTGELIRFCKQMASILNSGGNLLRALEMIGAETRNRVMQRTVREIMESLDGGGSLSEALAHHPQVFSTLFVSVVEVGEHTGRLGPSLLHIAGILQQEHEAKQKAMKTLMYPVAIMGLSMVVLVVLLLVAMPPLIAVFDRMDTEIPLMTQIALSSVSAVRDNFVTAMVIIAALAAAFKLAHRHPRVGYFLDAVRLRLPLVGPLTITGELTRFARIMTMMLTAGVPLSSALQQGLHGCQNRVFRQALMDADESLMSGRSLVEGLKTQPLLPGLFLQFVIIGEESNTLHQTMAEAADTYQAQQEAMLNTVMGMMEPMSTVVVGGIVGFIAFSMFVPIYSAMDALG